MFFCNFKHLLLCMTFTGQIHFFHNFNILYHHKKKKKKKHQKLRKNMQSRKNSVKEYLGARLKCQLTPKPWWSPVEFIRQSVKTCVAKQPFAGLFIQHSLAQNIWNLKHYSWQSKCREENKFTIFFSCSLSSRSYSLAESNISLRVIDCEAETQTM